MVGTPTNSLIGNPPSAATSPSESSRPSVAPMALMIVAMGATLGLLLSLGLVAALGGLPIKEFVGVPTISPAVLVATLTLLALVAFAAGLMPARRAAALDPVEALRS